MQQAALELEKGEEDAAGRSPRAAAAADSAC